jgi:hypothetical protein
MQLAFKRAKRVYRCGEASSVFQEVNEGYYGLVRTGHTSSLFILLEWNTVLVTTLMVRSMYLDMVEEDTDVLEFDAMFTVKTVLCHCQFDCLTVRDKPVFLCHCNIKD